MTSRRSKYVFLGKAETEYQAALRYIQYRSSADKLRKLRGLLDQELATHQAARKSPEVSAR